MADEKDDALPTVEVDTPDDIEIELLDDEEESTDESVEHADAGDDEAAQAAENAGDEAESGEAEAAAGGDDDDAVADDVDPEDDESLKTLKPKFTKRLKREWRAKKEAQRIAQQAIELGRQREAEVATLKQQNLKLQVSYAEMLETSLDQQVKAKSQEVRQAREAGEFDTETKLQSEIDDIRFKLNKVRDIRATLPSAEEVDKAPPAGDTQPKPKPQDRPLPAKAQAWVAKNKAWLQNEEFAAERAALVALDAQVKAAGFDPEDEDYYRELDKRLDKKFPTLRKKPAVPPKKSPVAPAAAGGAAAASAAKATGGKVVITAQDRATMRSFNLDPANPEHLKAWAREKRAAQQA